MYGPLSPVEAKVLRFAKDHRGIQQHGQSSDGKVHQGRTACTHTVWQFIAEVWTGEHHSLNRINRLAGLPPNAMSGTEERGMLPSEAEKLIAELGLPYVLVLGRGFRKIRRHLKDGPVMYATRYGSMPRWKDYVYDGISAKKPFAIRAGTTQLGPGAANVRHAVILLADRRVLALPVMARVTRPAGAKLRADTDVDSALVGTIPAGTRVKIAGEVQGGTWVVGGQPGTTWYRITEIDGAPVSSVFHRPAAHAAAGQFTLDAAPGGSVLYRKDPNHGSTARKERPPFDLILPAQARREYRDYHDKLGLSVYAAIPTRTLPV